METVAFYSYKGGVGRSLLLANAARFLASLGKGVVALDLDFEAPGLHYKLGAADYGDPKAFHLVSGGAVPYLNATAEGSNSPPKLQDHMLNRPVPVTEGWLKLMPAVWRLGRGIGQHSRNLAISCDLVTLAVAASWLFWTFKRESLKS